MMTNQLPRAMDPLCPDGHSAARHMARRRVDPATSAFDHSRRVRRILLGRRGRHAVVDMPKRNMAGVMMAQRQMAFVHPFSFEFKRLAY